MRSSARKRAEPSVEIIGVHPVKAKEPCHLVELWVHDCQGAVEMTEFTQADPNTTSSNWQVPWDDSLMNTEGTRVLCLVLEGTQSPKLWRGEVRIAFFFHYLDLKRPLETPFGDAVLPQPTPRPVRLRVMRYDAPD